ncbi:MAG: hypothetical protein GXO50_04825 [Chlorobi bacterium]|nr:hypothetical protein [Chlorobiota bacterium]
MSMNITSLHKKICNSISAGKLSDALLSTEKIISELKNPVLKDKLLTQKETYAYLLEYNLKGIEDPQKEKICNGIKKQLYEIADKAKSEYILNHDKNNKLAAQKKLLTEQIKNNGITIEKELTKLATSKPDSENEDRKIKLNKLFFLIWLTDEINENDYLTIKKYAASKKLFAHEASVTVSALTISSLRHFDKRKILAMFDFYDADKHGVWHRALTGIILNLYFYDNRIHLYDDIIKRLKSISNDEDISEHTANIIYQIIRSKETERLSERLQNEIIPEMRKFGPEIQDKLNLDDIISDGLIEDSNPDWEEIFDDAPELLDKMADFSKMQLEGSDVFMSAFAGFKNFPFFRQAANWFMPFYAENADIKNTLPAQNDDSGIKTFVKTLEKAAYICNSDKYSFCFNLSMMPATQKKMIAELFKKESEQMEEIAEEDKILNKKNEDKYIFTRYIQDIYRFYKLHPLKNDFEDIFDTGLDIHNTKLFKILIKDNSVIEKIAELNFKKEFFADAAEILEKITFKDLKKEAKRLEKTGFCYQKNKNFEKALENYKKAEIIKDPSLWLIKKIAFCNRKLKNFDEALKYYLKAEPQDPENLHIQANIGHCKLALKDYKGALKQYFKVEYYDPDNKSVMRPLAWCSFAEEKFDTAENYYKKLLKNKPTEYDFINYGHLLLAKKQKTDAAEMYAKAVKISGIEILENAFDDDAEILKKYEIKKDEIKILTEYVKLKISGQPEN